MLAHFIRTHIRWSLRKSLLIGIPCILAGYLITAAGFHNGSLATSDYYVAELSWRFCTFNIALMSFGMFVILRHIDCEAPAIYRPIKKISALSYGIYLMHIFILTFMFGLISPFFSTPWTILLVSAATILACCLIAWLISKLPYSKYIIG